MNHFKRIVHLGSRALAWVGQWFLIVVMLIVLVAILLRLLRMPTIGIFELVCLLAGIVLTFGWGHTQVEKGHLRVDMLVSRLPKRAQSVIDSITYLLSVGICFLMSWNTILLGTELLRSGEVITQYIRIPYYPVIYAIGFSITIFCLVLLIDLFDSLVKAVRK